MSFKLAWSRILHRGISILAAGMIASIPVPVSAAISEHVPILTDWPRLDNQAPVNTVPGPQTLPEGGTLMFSPTVGNPIWISDVDAGNNPLQVSLSVLSGTLTLSGTAGLVFSTGDGLADASMVFTGTLPSLNAALDGLRFEPTPFFNGPTRLTLTSNDLGHTGDGGAQTDTDSVDISVTAVNNPPLNIVPGAQAVPEGGVLVFSSARGNPIWISDVDAGNNPLQVSLSVLSGTLTLSGTAGLVFSTGDGLADASMVFTGTIPSINAALDGLRFEPTPSFNGPTRLTLASNDLGHTGDGGAQTDTDSVDITVTAVNDPPILDLNGSNPGRDYAAIFVEGRGPTHIVDPNALTVEDIDSIVLASAVVTITNPPDHGAERLTADSTGTGITLSYDPTTGALALKGPATPADFQTVLRTVAYNNTNHSPAAGERTVTFSVSDGEKTSSAISIVTVQRMPRIHLPIVIKSYNCALDPYEPNDSPDQAYLVSSKTTLTASFCEPGNKDEYRFAVHSTNTPIELSLTGIPSNSDYDMYLHYLPDLKSNPDNPSLARSNQSGNADEFIRYSANRTGEYLVLVYAYVKGPSAGSQNYRLRLAFD